MFCHPIVITLCVQTLIISAPDSCLGDVTDPEYEEFIEALKEALQEPEVIRLLREIAES